MLKTAIAACRDAGKIALKNFKGDIKVSDKGKFDLVTDIDILCENVMIKKVKAKYPGHRIIAEESGLIDARSEFTWILDPIDGTINYAHGFPYFNISIGILKNGVPVVGVVYDPLHDEMFYAEKGKGAFMNYQSIAVSKTSSLKKAFLVSEFTTKKNFLAKQFMVDKKISRFIMGLRITSSTSLNMAYCAIGRFDGYIKSNVKFLDYVAGSVILSEAGGKITDLSGNPFSEKSKSIVASNKILHKKIIDAAK